MKVARLIILLLLTLPIYGQNDDIFNSGVRLNNIERVDGYEVPISILFQFDGDPALIEYFQNLETLIIEQFKLTDIKLIFNYNIGSKTKEDTNLFSKEKSIDSICFLSLTNLKSWDNKYEDLRRQTYNLELKMISHATNKEELSGIIDVKTLNHIGTENLKISEVIFIAIAAK